MQNALHNLSLLIENLKTVFEKKKELLDNSKLGVTVKIEARIKALEVSQVEIEGLYSTNENMMLNFRKRVADITSDINKL